MKRPFSIALIFSFLLHLAGFYVYFVVRQNQIHQEARSKLKTLPVDQLEIIPLSKSEYRNSLRGDDEMEVNGKMYDIARVEGKKDKVIVYCLHDSSEDNLLSFLDEVLKNAAQDSQQATSSLFHFNFLSFVLPFDDKVETPCVNIFPPFTNYLMGDLSFIISISTPPPRV